MKYNYVYIITNKINHKFYIGKHSTNNLDDGYMGSGITINNAIQKYGIENFTKRILCFCDSADDAYKVEEFLVTDNLIKRGDCYNMVVGGRGNFLPDHFGEKNPFFGKHHSEEQKQKWRETRKGKNTGCKNPMFGKHHSEEQKKKWSELRKGKYPSEETKKKISEANKGKHRSEETKKKISEANKGKQTWLKGTHRSEETKKKMSESQKGRPQPKYKWLTPTEEIKEMGVANVKYHHPDWVLYEQN